MTMLADIQRVFRGLSVGCGLSKSSATLAYLRVVGALEWDIEGVDYGSYSWERQEFQLAYKELFGEDNE